MIPVTILTGFLGSGKTTLLSHLLRQPELAGTAVIINEFGEVGLDHDLVASSTENLIELSTGCLCCQVRGDLAELLMDLLARRDAGDVQPFGRVVIETSGLADPAPVLHMLMTDEALAQRLVLGRVVVTVDATGSAAALDREPVSVKQVALADRLVLTKTDLSPPAADLSARLAALNPSALLLRSDRGRIDPGLLLTGSFWSPEARTDAAFAWLGDEAAAGAAAVHHDGDVSTFSIVRETPFPAVALTLLLETLAEHCGADLLRLKGILSVAEHPQRPAVIHGVQHVFHPLEWLDRWPSGDRRSRIVVIGRGIRRGWVEALIDCIVAEVEEAAKGATG